MKDQLQQLLEQVYEQIRGAARFRWQSMIVAWVVCIVGWVVVAFQPNLYKAQARVYVDTRTSLGPVLQGLTISQDMGAQLNRVRQSLLGRPQLERVAREADIDLGVTSPEAREGMLAKIRADVSLDGRDFGGGTVYTIGFLSKARETSLKVVDTLVNSFINDTLGGKRSGTETAQGFLREQIKDYELRLREAEQRLAEFKRRNVGQMPGAQGDYFTRLQAEMAAVDKVRAQVSNATIRRDELQRQLRGEGPSDARSATGLDPDGSVALRIKEAQARLEELLLRFTEKHPDVIAAKATLQQLEQRRIEALEALRRGERGGLLGGTSANPVLQSIQLALNQVEVEIAALGGDLAGRQRAVADLQKLVDTVPEVEAEFSRLNRDYDVTRSQYTALVERLDKANLGEQAESTESIRFEVIDPPAAAFDPVKPNRMLLMVAVLIVGLSAGAALAYLLHMLKPVFHSSRALNQITGLPVLGVVSMTWLDRYKSRQLKSYAWFSVGIAFLVIAFVVALQLQPLGVRLAQRLIG